MDDSFCWESSDYEILAEIGQGAYGKVYKARERRGQQRFIAVKRLNIPEEPESGIPQFVIREVALSAKNRALQPPQHSQVRMETVKNAIYVLKSIINFQFEYHDISS